MEYMMEVSQKLKTNYHMKQQSHSWLYIQKTWKQDLEIFHTQVHRVLCTTLKRGKQSTPSLDENMNEVWYIQTMETVTQSSKGEGNPFMCHNMDETWGCHTKWNKLLKKTNSVLFYLNDIFNIGTFMKVE